MFVIISIRGSTRSAMTQKRAHNLLRTRRLQECLVNATQRINRLMMEKGLLGVLRGEEFSRLCRGSVRLFLVFSFSYRGKRWRTLEGILVADNVGRFSK